MLSKEKIQELVNRSYDIACKHGFHDSELSVHHWLMLVLSEVGEMVEADRKGRHANRIGFEKCVGLTWGDRFRDYIKDSVEDEMADVAIRLFDFCGTFHISPLDVVTLYDDGINMFVNGAPNGMSFVERCFMLSCLITRCEVSEHNKCKPSVCVIDMLTHEVTSVLLYLFAMADVMGVDLAWHIDMKMKYNERRAHKHGKKY